tara:strand:+ start:80 stop:325 length:246 start_codon:yes stop_codon:yes gene_type:complete
MILSEQEVTEITKHFMKWKNRGDVEEWELYSMKYNSLGIRIIITMRGQEFTIVPPKGYQLTEVTIINLLKMRFEIYIKKSK